MSLIASGTLPIVERAPEKVPTTPRPPKLPSRRRASKMTGEVGRLALEAPARRGEPQRRVAEAALQHRVRQPRSPARRAAGCLRDHRRADWADREPRRPKLELPELQ